MFQRTQHTTGHQPNTHEQAKKPFVLQRKGENNFQRDEAGKIIGIQRKEAGTQNTSAPTKAAEPNKTGMPDDLRSGLESLSGEDLSDVRVHRNSSKPGEIQAHAYTQGQDIYLGPGQEKHLPHEGWHAVQQKQGRVQPTIQQKNALINDDSTLEREADVMGDKAVQMKSDNGTAPAKKNRNATRNGVIQRAMKFEYQYKNHYFYRDDGEGAVTTLPRKYGPRDFIMRSFSEATMESEEDGQIEFETRWEKKWSKLGLQVRAIQNMSRKLRDAETVTASNGNTYRKFPFPWLLKHLRANKGFAEGKTEDRWSDYQRDGKSEVQNKSGTSANMMNNNKTKVKAIVPNGTEVFQHYLSEDKKWVRIQYQRQFGWIRRSHLTSMDPKIYENFKSGDTQLGKGEQILIDASSRYWKPYVQISEFFGMTQYSSYLEQYDNDFYTGNASKVRNFLMDNDPNAPKSSSFPATGAARKFGFLAKNMKLYNLLLMIAHYVEVGDNVKGKPAKYTFSLMSRTHFGAMFKSMEKHEQDLFKALVDDKKDGILSMLGVAGSKKIFADGSGSDSDKNHDPSVIEWLVSISEGKDLLSSQESSVSDSMGAFNINDDGKHKDLVRFEARNDEPNFPTIDGLETHAKEHFDLAKENRKRTNGTQLE